MPNKEAVVIQGLEKAKAVIELWVPMFEQYNTPSAIGDAIALLKEQEQIINGLEDIISVLKESAI